MFAAERSADGVRAENLDTRSRTHPEPAPIRIARHDEQTRVPENRSRSRPVPVLANIIGPELLIVLAVVALLFGGSRLPTLARSLGSAKGEFERGRRDDPARDEQPPR
jgi:sec-independent protein translocase protein TatA